MKSAVVVFLALFVFGMVARGDAAEPDGQAEALWRAAAREQADLETRQPLFQDPKLTTYLDGVLRRLWSLTSTELPQMQLRVVKNNRSQAFTYPNGRCYLTTGLLVSLRSEDQLAMILAHEMTHYLDQHTLRAWNHLRPDDATSDPPAGSFAPSRDAPRSSMAFDLEMELEADAGGLKLMRGAGYCPDQVIPLLQTAVTFAEASTDSAIRMAHARAQAARKLIAHGNTPDACKGEDEWSGRQTAYDRGIATALLADSRLAVQQGLWDRARENLARYRNVSEADAEILFLTGELLRRNDDHSGQMAALSAYQGAIELDHTFAPAYRALGMVNFKLGRKERAKRYFENFLALIPNSPDNFFIRDYLHQCSN